MARLIKFFALLLFAVSCPSFAALRGNIDYTIPIEYKNLSEAELEAKAEVFYNSALKTTDGKLNENITQSLVLYNALSRKNPENIIYALRAGSLYDLIGKDRYAKGCYCRAMGVDSSRPEPYFYMGEFYYKRQLYRRALKMYKRAYEHGYSNHPQTVLRLKQLYLMLDDKESRAKI